MPDASPPVARRFGRFVLRGLLHASAALMLWEAEDTARRQSAPLLLLIPRQRLADDAAQAAWIRGAQAAARIEHPELAVPIEVAVHERWPYLAYELGTGVRLLSAHLKEAGDPQPATAAGWARALLGALAYAHDAGHAHRDVQTAHLLIDERGRVRLIGLGALQGQLQDSREADRAAAEADVLDAGILLHTWLSGQAHPDLKPPATWRAELPPQGGQTLRLGWDIPHPIADPLRAIVNRATDRVPRQRYHLARSFQRALDGWLALDTQDGGGPIVALLNRIQQAGLLPGPLPGRPSTALSLQSLAALDTEHTRTLSSAVLQDLPLALELLKRVNQALRRQGHGSEEAAVLNMQRAIALLGLVGVQQAALAIQPWPGTLESSEIPAFEREVSRIMRAAVAAQKLRPAGYDADVVYLIAVLQSLGRLLAACHFPQDMAQIHHLVQGTPEAPGMSEEAAAYAVLGCDLGALGHAVAQHWDLGDEVLAMMRRHSADKPVRSASTDADLLRLTSSLAYELIEAESLPLPRRQEAIELATRRYARVLGLGPRDVQQALDPWAGEDQDAA